MAQLSSAGVSVTVVDESFYTSAAPGTVPLIIVASQANKKNNAGTGTAKGTLAANAGKVYLLTSQSDLGATFGVPYFETDAENNPVNAGELNEYGLQAAYSFLGVSNRAYVVRADLDTRQLIANSSAPTNYPADGTYWFDIADTHFGVFQWNSASATTTGGQLFQEQASIKNLSVITNTSLINVSTLAPLPSYGAVGDYAIVATTTLNKLWLKKFQTDTAAGTWVEVGTSSWSKSWPTVTGTINNPTLTATGTSFSGYISGTTLNVTSAVTGGVLLAGDVLSTVAGGFSAGTQITATNTATFTGSFVSTGTTLTVSGVTGTIAIGMSLSGGTVGTGIYIVSGSGTSWVVSASQTAGTTVTTATGYTVSATQTVASIGSPAAFTTGGDSLTVNGSLIAGVTTVTALATAINTAGISGVTAASINGYLQIYSSGVNVVVGAGAAVAKLGLAAGTYLAPQLQISPHYNIPLYGIYDGFVAYGTANSPVTTVNGAPTGSLWIKATSINLGANWFVKKWNAATSTWIQQATQLFASNQAAMAVLDPTGGGINIPVGAVYVKYNDGEFASPYANFKIYGRASTGATAVVSGIIAGTTFPTATYSFTITASQIGSATLGTTFTVSFTSTGSATSDAQALLAAFGAVVTDPLLAISLNTTTNVITITHAGGGDMRLVDGAGTPLSKLFSVSTTTNFYIDPTGAASKYIATQWASTVSGSAFAVASLTSPTTVPVTGTLWYSSNIEEVDIMVNSGSAWVGYKNYSQNAVGGSTTDANGPMLMAAVAPTAQSTGLALANGDLWIDTSDLENFPKIYKYNYLTKKWVPVDNADQTSGNGIVFADARWSTDGGVANGAAASSITALLSSNYLDFDAPDPALYPKGMLLWNLRRSGFNVKRYVQGYVNPNSYNVRMSNQLQTGSFPDRWVTAAPNNYEGAGAFGRKAQRAVVLQALKATIESNQNIRQPDTVIFNLLSCPGYLETSSALVNLNTDNGQTAFIVADTPARLEPDATSLNNWGNNTAKAVEDGEEGLITTDSYTAVYYPWGYTTDLMGKNIVVPPSHIMLRTIALSDNVSYPWFAPAGVRRGGVTNASSVGYVDAASGEFRTVALNTGQRDTLAGVHVNPITYIAGTGLVAYGQYTRQLIASSLDRINVARLVIYLRYQLNKLAKPFIFEPNDTITRNEIKQQVEKLLLELTAERALYDYVVVCDKSNNTPSRIDASELYVDIAIEPVKAVEFIYIPLRLENTGGIKGLSK